MRNKGWTESDYRVMNNIDEITKVHPQRSILDKKIITYTLQLIRKQDTLFPENIGGLPVSTLLDTPYMNQASSAEEMESVLLKLAAIQQGSQMYNNGTTKEQRMETLPLDWSEMENISKGYRKQLAQWMLAQRPRNGYEDYISIQAVFDRFFAEVTEQQYLLVDQLNQAVEKGDTTLVLTAILESDQLILPDGFNRLTEEERQALAEVLIGFPSGESIYKNDEQIQYILELAYQGLRVSQARQLSTMLDELNQLYVKWSEGSEHFANFTGIKELTMLYLQGSVVDQMTIAYTMLLRNKQNPHPSEMMGLIPLTVTENIPYINRAESSEDMLIVLSSFLNLRQRGEAYNECASEEQCMEVFPLNLAALVDMSPQYQKQLATWLLEHKPVHGYSHYDSIQVEIDSFSENIKRRIL